ncbi:MAG: hypothetical protein H6744_21360 [Deltaproteobacteria bacterium]|nr:hypothetical protein [Deltaproteobacteria bacterium]MCB9789232.1 hypothetical protein [Deltaproteobacteria bacterium]
MSSQAFTRISAIFGAAMVAVVGGCATTGAKPEDMSAEAHREQAARDAQQARAHDARYDETAIGTKTPPGARGLRGPAASKGFNHPEQWGQYNPTEWHRAQARRFEQHSTAHLEAAKALEGFEDEKCKQFGPEVRSACPLMGPVVSVEPIDGGVRMYFQLGVDMAKLTAHVQCHLAFGRTQGHEGMPGCPLYLPDLTVKQVGDQGLELTTDDASNVEELRRRAAEHVTH